jgi:hypothetical protein
MVMAPSETENGLTAAVGALKVADPKSECTGANHDAAAGEPFGPATDRVLKLSSKLSLRLETSIFEPA